MSNIKKYLIVATMFLLIVPAHAQKYKISFAIPDAQQPDSILYLGQHYRDKFIILDSARLGADNTYTFSGKRKWETGIYALVDKAKKKNLIDFTIDDSRKFAFTLTPSYKVAVPTRDIAGSAANMAMYSYINHIDSARSVARDIEKRQKSADIQVKNEAEHDMELLNNEMTTFEKTYIQAHKEYRFFQLIDMFDDPEVPESVADKSVYYCTHYWDKVDFSDHSLVRTPDLFNKMSCYFFRVLYHAETDTICKYADMVLKKIENDTLMMHYFMDYIMPRYYRSTKNIGWDATWCYLVRQYYLTGKCGWAKESEISNKRQTAEFLEQSLIGARGAELWMADTNQSDNPQKWISSHRFPEKYVVLWFWDPDCHHCQEQTAQLQQVYDSMCASGNKLFEVYAVGYEADVAKWKKYVREHHLPFVNVGGNNVNIDYQEAYNVHGAPTMIILNEERRIIMNKNIPAESIIPFIKRYEKKRDAERQQTAVSPM